MLSPKMLPITETYEDVRLLIYSVCNAFRRRHGGDVEEMIAEANIIFMKVTKVYDRKKGALSTILVLSINRRLEAVRAFNYRRRNIQRISLDRPLSEDGESLASLSPGEDHWGEFEFFDALTADARYVARLALESPAEIADVARGKGGYAMNWRSSLRDHLKDIGWAATRISKSFDEIRSALV